jgi:hypothetical protein
VTDFFKAYQDFCQKEIDENETIETLVNRKEIQEFGINYIDTYTTTYITGIINNREIGKGDSVTKYVRIPVTFNLIQNKLQWRKLLFRARIKWFKYDGPVATFLAVLIDMVSFIIIPYSVMWFIMVVRFAIGRINEDPYANTYNMFDLFNANSKDFWFSKAEGNEITYIFMWFNIIGCFILIIEMISYYSMEDTQYNFQRYIIKRTPLKWISTICLWIWIAFYAWLVMTYLFLILAWSILAAILYPERFLVLASAAVVFIGFSIQTYRSIMKFVDNLQFEVERLIDEQLQSILRYTINKAKTEVRKTLQMKEIKAWEKTVNNTLSKLYLPKISLDKLDMILEGDANEAIDALSESFKLSKRMSLILLGTVHNDPQKLKQGLNMLINLLKIDYEIKYLLKTLINCFDDSEKDIVATRK